MVIGQNGYGPKWIWTEMFIGRNDPEPLYNEPQREKTNIMHMRKQRHEADQRLCFR